MCSEIKGADQLRGYFAFVGYMQNVGFLMTRLICIFTEAVTHVEVIVLQWFSYSLPRAVSSIPGVSSISDES